MLRKSNLTALSAPQFDESKQLLASDISFDGICMNVNVRWAKNMQFGDEEHVVPIIRNPDSVVCAFKAVIRMLRAVNMMAGQAVPLFGFFRGRGKVAKPVTYKQFQEKFRKFIGLTGRVAEAYSSHSVRRGGATAQGAAGVPRHYIAEVGNWRSAAIDNYLYNPMETRVKAALALNQHLARH